MKRVCFLLACLVTLQLQAQNNFKVTSTSVVKDSSGTVYPYNIWQGLMMTGGYTLKAENPKDPNTAFLLVQLSAQQKEERFQKMPRPRESDFFKTGEKIKLFNTRDINNTKINLKEAKGKIIVLNFWFINCGPCRREIPELNALVDSFRTNEKVLFIGVALDGRDDLENFLAQSPFKYTIIDGGRSIASDYGIRLFPTHVIVDTEGKVYFHTSGLAVNTVYWIRKSIKELLAKTEKDVAAP